MRGRDKGGERRKERRAEEMKIYKKEVRREEEDRRKETEIVRQTISDPYHCRSTILRTLYVRDNTSMSVTTYFDAITYSSLFTICNMMH